MAPLNPTCSSASCLSHSQLGFVFCDESPHCLPGEAPESPRLLSSICNSLPGSCACRTLTEKWRSLGFTVKVSSPQAAPHPGHFLSLPPPLLAPRCPGAPHISKKLHSIPRLPCALLPPLPRRESPHPQNPQHIFLKTILSERRLLFQRQSTICALICGGTC